MSFQSHPASVCHTKISPENVVIANGDAGSTEISVIAPTTVHERPANNRKI